MPVFGQSAFGNDARIRSIDMMMRHIRAAIAAGVTTLALVAGVHLGHAQQVSTALASKAPEAGSIATMAQTNGQVRVIVLLNAPAIANQARPDAAAIATAKAQVAAIQDTVLARHFGDARNLRQGQGFTRQHSRFEITPGFAINVDVAELEALAADPQVKSINIDRARPPLLLQSVPLIGQPTAYSNGATGAGWAVAVLDTGVQSNHEFLSGKVVAEACFSNANGFGGNVSLCPNGLSSQTGGGSANSTTAACINGSSNLCWHGTHVAGIAAGLNTSQNSGEPINGVARDGKIFAIQVFTRFNSASDCNPSAAPCVASYDSDQVRALDYIYQHLTPVAGVNVASVNMSLGGGPNTSSACDSDLQKTSIDNLRAAGVLTAIASGNDGDKTTISHPACISSAVAVGSTTKSDVVSSFSNMATIVALLAPGGSAGGNCQFGANNLDIMSSYADISSATTAFYACAAGTSMATPHVAGRAFVSMPRSRPSIATPPARSPYRQTRTFKRAVRRAVRLRLRPSITR
ncbi:MAG: S8 family serine peptidase [Rhizobiales bacterium]|nr:S8 family serine peptidase [Hyphomicrobiales bacterium]